jgi:riboflavin kinase/FMN adenylyltransferase
MGFPTANIVPLFPHKLIPRTGVYAVEATISGEHGSHVAMLNIGHRPTISDSDGIQTIEVHIIDFSEDLYGREMTVRFRHRLRDEMKFRTGMHWLHSLLKTSR